MSKERLEEIKDNPITAFNILKTRYILSKELAGDPDESS